MGIEIKSFAVGQADCFLIEMEETCKYFNLLVDCGDKNLLSEIKRELGDRKLNGIVATHVDDDHIIGIIDLLENDKNDIISNKTFLIYNKYDESMISYEKGQKLFELIKERSGQKLLIKSYAGNYYRENAVIKRRSRDTELPVHLLSKNQRRLIERNALEKNTVYITMLSPNISILKKFMRNWNTEHKNASLTNRSSIVFLLEFNEKSILMLGDAMAADVGKELKQIRGLKHIDYIKIAHHGARNSNKGLTDIVKQYSCKKAVVTISAEQSRETNHPSRSLIAELENEGCEIYTSTNYHCNNPGDVIHHIKIKEKLTI